MATRAQFLLRMLLHGAGVCSSSTANTLGSGGFTGHGSLDNPGDGGFSTPSRQCGNGGTTLIAIVRHTRGQGRGPGGGHSGGSGYAYIFSSPQTFSYSIEQEDNMETPTDIGTNNAFDALDQVQAYPSKEEAVAAYLVNVVDTARENRVSPEEAVRSFLSTINEQDTCQVATPALTEHEKGNSND